MSDAGAPKPAPTRSRQGYVLTSGILIVMMLGGTLPVPLYVLYEPKMGFGPLGVTMVFAAYVASVLVILLAFGDLSDHIGRRKVLVVAILFAVASTVVFLVATNIGELILARVLSGAGAGLATGTATAALSELEPRGDLRRAAILAAASNQLGLGLGPLIAGVFAEYVAAPTRTVFWLYLAMTAVALLAVVAIPETVTAPARAFRIRLHVGVPPSLRAMMLGAMLGVFAAFALLGLFSSLVPTFLHGILGVHNLAVIGAASFLIFATAGVSQALFAGLSSRAAAGFGLPMLLVGLGALEVSLSVVATWLFVIGTVVGGIGVGLVFRGGLSEINRLVEPAHRAEVISSYFAAAYLGLGIPVVLIGFVSLAVSTVDASAWISGLVAAVIVLAAGFMARTFGRTATASRDTGASRATR
jgi:MFS family permease